MSLPIDTSKVKFVSGDNARPQIVFETGAQKTNRDGEPVYLVRVVAFPAGAAAEVVDVKVPGEPKGLQLHAPVRVTGLEVRPWNMIGKDGKPNAGLAYWATAIEPETAAPAPAPK